MQVKQSTAHWAIVALQEYKQSNGICPFICLLQHSQSGFTSFATREYWTSTSSDLLIIVRQRDSRTDLPGSLSVASFWTAFFMAAWRRSSFKMKGPFVPGDIMVAPEFASHFTEDANQLEAKALVQRL